MIRLLLVDDEPLALRRLRLQLERLGDVDIVGVAHDGDTALEQLAKLKPDLVFLDVEMPGASGIAVARSIEGTGGPEIIFLTAFDHYAAAAFAVEAIDYLLKPLSFDRLRQSLDRARRRLLQKAAVRGAAAPGGGAPREATEPAEPAHLHLPDRHGGRDLAQADIVWIEAAKDYALIHTRTRTHILRTTMSELPALLIPAIIRVHRSAFVAVACVRQWTRPRKGVYGLILTDGTEIQVGPNYVHAVRARLRRDRPDMS